jgi:hypothetical protein
VWYISSFHCRCCDLLSATTSTSAVRRVRWRRRIPAAHGRHFATTVRLRDGCAIVVVRVTRYDEVLCTFSRPPRCACVSSCTAVLFPHPATFSGCPGSQFLDMSPQGSTSSRIGSGSNLATTQTSSQGPTGYHGFLIPV